MWSLLLSACFQPRDLFPTGDDCDDTRASINPGAEEICNATDDDCDTLVDDDAVNASTWYADADGDGYGDPATVIRSCTDPDDAVADATDCDDSDAATWPGAPGWSATCEPVDSGEPAPEETGTGAPAASGCGCVAGGGGDAGWLTIGVLGAVLAQRRGRRA
jgi:hypothetical protein